MEQTKFECQLAPVGDPNMKVEWFFNGRPLPYSEFFLTITTLQQLKMVACSHSVAIKISAFQTFPYY